MISKKLEISHQYIGNRGGLLYKAEESSQEEASSVETGQLKQAFQSDQILADLEPHAREPSYLAGLRWGEEY